MNPDTPPSTAKAAIFLGNLALLLLLLMPVAALASRFGLWHFTIGLLLTLVSVIGCFLVQIITSIWLMRKPAAATKDALRKASLLALPPLLIMAFILFSSKGTDTPIHNVSTDLENPPAFVAAIEQRGEHSNPLTYTADIAAIQRQVFPELQPIISTVPPAVAFALALATLDTMGLDIYAQHPAEGRIEAVATSFWFGFKDDMVVRIQPQAGGSRIDLRSVSRVGKSDLGANARRIARFNELFNQQSH